MKKIFTTALFVMAAAGAMAQTFVSTQPSKRNVLIEEFTGVNCQYCPIGHKCADQMIEMFPGHVFSINIHQGMYATNGFTTQWGNALAAQSNISGYPSAVVNRHPFTGSSLSVNPGEFYPRTLEVMAMDAPVNIAAVVDIDPTTRLMTVRVEGYYTADGGADYNLLNVALIQNNIMGSQAGGSSWYPENMEGGRYRHKHVLRDLLTGQWGDTISQTTAGSFFSRTYNYVASPTIGGMDASNLDDLEVLVFVCRDHKEVLNACQALRTGNEARLVSGAAEQDECQLSFRPYVTLFNATDQTITNPTIEVDGTTISRSRTLSPYATDTIQLPTFTIDEMPATSQHYVQQANVRLTNYSSNGQTVTPTASALQFTYVDLTLISANAPLVFALHYDNYPEEISFSMKDYGSCTDLFSVTGQTSQRGRNASYSISPAEPGIYQFTISDVGGDGLTGNLGMYDANNEVLFARNGADLMLWHWYINVLNSGDGTAEAMDQPVNPPTPQVGIESVDNQVSLQVWPNPAADRIRCAVEGPLRSVEVLDATGHTLVKDHSTEVDLSSVASGVYFLRVVTDNGVGVQRFVKQ